MSTVICPYCEEVIKPPQRLKIGQRMTCPYCDEKLVVMQLQPLELEWTDDDDREKDVLDWKRKKKRKDHRLRNERRLHYSWEEAHP
jgi:hypothetical protein